MDKLVAFLSYARADDRHAKGKIVRIAELLRDELRAQTGEPLSIFVDRNIEWGENWQRRINESLSEATMLIPILTPNYFNSSACRDELTKFLEREAQLGRNDLVLPIYYMAADKLEDPALRQTDELAEELSRRQYIDWRELRLKDLDSKRVVVTIADLAARMKRSYQRGADTGSTGGRKTRNTRKKASTGKATKLSKSVAPNRIWQFADEEPITIICDTLLPDLLPDRAQPTHLNANLMSSLADSDAIVDLYGSIRAENPATVVRVRAADRVFREELSSNLVFLGRYALNTYTSMIQRDQLPVRQRLDLDGVFVTETDGIASEFGPKFHDQDILQDVGLFARAPNPMDPSGTLTLTICGGITTRGVRGSVLCFVDPNLRDENEQFVAERFAGYRSFGFLMRVEVLPMSGEPLTPDLTREDTCLYYWPSIK